MNGTASQATTGMTSKQKRDLRRLQNDALDEAGLGKDRAQKLYGKGGIYKAGIKKLIAELTASDLLESVGTVNLSAIASFVAADRFRDDRKGEVVIGWIGDNFRRNFLGKTETDVPATQLHVYKLVKSSVDGPIIAELGEEMSETTLGQMFEMMKAQGHGEDGTLLTNGCANIFYIRDDRGTVWAVYCGWFSVDGCWRVEAGPVADPDGWVAGGQVVSR